MTVVQLTLVLYQQAELTTTSQHWFEMSLSLYIGLVLHV